MHYGATMEIFQIAERLRRDMTATEKILWERVCKNQLGTRIRRQHPIWKFIADFYCHQKKLIIELDGDIHLEKKVSEHDEGRTHYLKRAGIKVLRFKNEEVLNNTEEVLRKILKV